MGNIYIYPPTLPSTCQGRVAPGTTLGVERCFSCLSSMTYFSITFRRTFLVSRLCCGISNVTRCVCIRCSMAKMFPGALVSLLLPRLSHLTAHIIIQANSMGLIPKTGEQHLIENNNINQNNKQQKEKTKQHKQYNRL